MSKTVHHANGTTATTHYGWDGDRLVHEAKERHRTTVVYEPGSFVPMLRIDQAGDGAAKQISAYVTDALGTPMQLVTPRGDTLWQAQPDDWAAVTNEQGRTAQPIRFQGQWLDEESGLYYNRHRYYDPQQGRYINQDPIGLNGGTNLYGYVSNPTGMVDPLGLAGCYVLFPDYPINTGLGFSSTWLGGHAGVLGYDAQGKTQYYEFGRYAPDGRGVIGERLPAAQGNIRTITVPDLTLTEGGDPTSESLDQLRRALSESAGRGTRVEMTCFSDVDIEEMYRHIENFANNPGRPAYSWSPLSPNHCRTFANEAISAGQ
ncbi:RHS repeat protein [Halomonas sp. MCCC 1A11058]|uniref:RHS repeat protein n=1 Tax=Billgrantia aerodenitrificans TaxID=2733483 RepID=A0ABS9AVJ6_9GAMM|nr:RHS repeat protein [Halomonas aerodenitrificans]